MTLTYVGFLMPKSSLKDCTGIQSMAGEDKSYNSSVYSSESECNSGTVARNCLQRYAVASKTKGKNFKT